MGFYGGMMEEVKAKQILLINETAKLRYYFELDGIFLRYYKKVENYVYGQVNFII